MSCSESQMNEIVQKGVYYYPATSHYVRPCTVTCDRCMRTNLDASIGYNNLDLCMTCVATIAENLKSPVPKREDVLVRMMSDRFFEELRNKRNKKNNISKMISSKFNPSASADRDIHVSSMPTGSKSSRTNKNDNHITLMMSSRFDVNDRN